MSQSAPPVLTVRHNGAERTFAAGHDVVVGRDLRADVRVGHPLISRAHLVLRFDQGRWVAVDNGSLNGLYVNNRRVPGVDIQDGQHVHIGNPDGPELIFEVGRHQGSVGRPPQTTAFRIPNAPSGPVPVQAPHQTGAQWPGQAPPEPPATSRLGPQAPS
ncbi:MAG: FHA domain-containing protein, partial [Mycobacterium sp.]